LDLHYKTHPDIDLVSRRSAEGALRSMWDYVTLWWVLITAL